MAGVSWPTPDPGLVIRFSYLWRREADAGLEEGAKDRPCAVVLAIDGMQAQPQVVVLPITHAEPRADTDGIEIPASTKRRLGLDDRRSWIIVTEANIFVWPGPDLRFLPDRGPQSAAYGFLPPLFFRVVRDRFIAHWRVHPAGLVARTE